MTRAWMIGICLGLLVSTAAGETLEEYLATKIIADYRLDPDYTSINIARSALATDDVSGAEVKAYPLTQSAPAGRFSMRVELYQDGALVERGSVMLNVRRFADLMVPKQNIRRHELLTADMFTLKRFEVTSMTERMMSDDSQIGGCRAGQSLIAGRYVPLTRIEKIPDVENGGPVTIIGKGSAFEVRAKGLALQDGTIGETIRVKNVDSRRVLSGMITASGVVEIQL